MLGVFFHLLAYGPMVSFQGKAVVSPSLLYDRFCCCFLRIHSIRSHDAAPTAGLLHHLLHLGDPIALLINLGGGKAAPHSVDITLNSWRLRLSAASSLFFLPVLWVSFPSAAITSWI